MFWEYYAFAGLFLLVAIVLGVISKHSGQDGVGLFWRENSGVILKSQVFCGGLSVTLAVLWGFKVPSAVMLVLFLSPILPVLGSQAVVVRSAAGQREENAEKVALLLASLTWLIISAILLLTVTFKGVSPWPAR